MFGEDGSISASVSVLRSDRIPIRLGMSVEKDGSYKTDISNEKKMSFCHILSLDILTCIDGNFTHGVSALEPFRKRDDNRKRMIHKCRNMCTIFKFSNCHFFIYFVRFLSFLICMNNILEFLIPIF